MRQAMKQYVVAESKWQDLNTSKEKVSQSINQLLSEDITEELIRQVYLSVACLCCPLSTHGL
jgi:hypothetical protein